MAFSSVVFDAAQWPRRCVDARNRQGRCGGRNLRRIACSKTRFRRAVGGQRPHVFARRQQTRFDTVDRRRRRRRSTDAYWARRASTGAFMTYKPFRVLSLDGGGAKGFYTLGILREMEA